MAYTDADLLNLYMGYSYGSSSAEVSIQGLSSSDQARFAKLVESNWNAKNTANDAKAILSLQSKGIPFSSALIASVNRFQTGDKNVEDSKKTSTATVQQPDSSKLSTTSANSKNATAQAAGGVPETVDNNEIVVVAPKKAKSSSSSILASASSKSLSEANTALVVEAHPRNDRRARLSPKPAVFDKFITTDGIMAPLRETYGLMFPIAPTISENVEVNYESYDMAHGLMPIQAFRSGGQKTLTVTGMFTAQTDIEARYCLACIHFVRSFSKMNFGDSDPNAGTPPPILVFNAYGDAMFHNLPVVISSASFEWPNDVDYVYTTAKTASVTSVKNANSMIADGWVPSKFTITITLTVQQTPTQLRRFNLESFRNGTILRNGGWI